MKVSYKWLKELIDLEGYHFEEIADLMALKMIELETVTKVTDASNIVIGHVIEKKVHPNASKLSVCLVDIGVKKLQIVCGAPNVATGQKVLVALDGALLGNNKIKTCELRGELSEGMICSLSEIGLDSKFIPAEFTDGIYVLNDDAPIGVDALNYLAVDDITIELGLTPNRMDLLSMKGVANDLAAITKRQLFNEYYQLKKHSRSVNDELTVTIETPNCLCYYAKKIENIVIGESPNFIKGRLIAGGIRPINNVVDITNYILLLFGQPLHAFDADVLKNHIVIRSAYDNEQTVTLDGQERILNSADIVITDGQEVVCLGGVMGCKNTEVTPKTVNIVLEAAVFNNKAVRQTSTRLGLRSESSIRFERGVDLNQTLEALEYACYLLSCYANGEVLDGHVHQGLLKVADKEIKLRKDEVNTYLGLELSVDEIKEICEELGFVVKGQHEMIIVVPNRRMDINIKEDLIEEIARIYGYDKMPETKPLIVADGALKISQKRRRQIQNVLSELGFNEVITYTLVSEIKNELFSLNKNGKAIKLLNPLSEERYFLRQSLIPSLIEVAKYNSARKNKDLAMFELGCHYCFDEVQNAQETHVLGLLLTGEYSSTKWQQKNEKVDFYLIKGIVEAMFRRLGVSVVYQPLSGAQKLFHPHMSAQILYQNNIIGIIGALHPSYLKDNDLDDTFVCELDLTKILNYKCQTITYKPLIKTPSIERDLALVVSKDCEVGQMIETIYRTDRQIISNVNVFDLYVGEKVETDQKSVAFRVTFSFEDGLTDEIINNKVNLILLNLAKKHQAMLRK